MINYTVARDGLGVSIPGEDIASSFVDSVSDWWRLRKEADMQAADIAATREQLLMLADAQDAADIMQRDALAHKMVSDDNRTRARTGLMWGAGALALVVLAVLT